MINYIIYSKDRASQLDLLLRSIDKYAKGKIDCHVIYRASNVLFMEAYDKLFAGSRQYGCLRAKGYETDFRDNTLHVVTVNPCKLFGFFTDDTVLFKPFSLTENDILEEMNAQNCYAFSLRSGLNITKQCHYRDEGYVHPKIVVQDDDLFMWDTSKHSYATNNGRPMSIDGNFFTYDELLKSLVEFPWNCPRTLDGIDVKYIGPYMMSFKHSIAVNIPVNLTAGGYADNWGHFHQYSLECLNDKFLEGHPIDLESLKFDDIHMSHHELELVFQ